MIAGTSVGFISRFQAARECLVFHTITLLTGPLHTERMWNVCSIICKSYDAKPFPVFLLFGIPDICIHFSKCS